MNCYAEGDLVHITILVNHDPVAALSFITHRAAAENRERAICARLKDLIPRQLGKVEIPRSAFLAALKIDA
jgi:GTP-binding protein LepA